MAKGLRSSVKKSNRTKLRQRVFGPVEAARAVRIHARLLETVQQPKPEQPQKTKMDIDPTEDTSTAIQEDSKEDDYPKDMEVDDNVEPAATKSKTKQKADKAKIKQRRRKPRNQISFPKTHGKGALKPHSASGVRKQRR